MSPFVPTPEQELALTHPAPLLVLAGAGTGKTTVLTWRIARAIATAAVRPDQVLALTFTDKAAAEMGDRIYEVLGEVGRRAAARDAFVGTFHSFGGLVIRENLLRLGFDHPPDVISAPAAWQLLAAVFDDLSFDAIEISTGSPGTVFGHLLHVFSQCKDHLVGPEDLDRYAAQIDPSAYEPTVAEYLGKRGGETHEVAAAYRRYEAAKKEKCLIDFGDHLYLPVRLFREHPEVRDAYRRRYPLIFVDEYQDTNHAQRELLLHLIDPARPGIMVIGDDDQAIYRWRGAVVQNILRFHEESIFAPGQVKLVPMTLNRRSLPPILDLANLAISQVPTRHAKELRYHKEKAQGRAVIGHYLAASDRREAEWIAAKIREIEPTTRELAGQKRGHGAFAVLCRKRSLFEPVGRALERAGIPYELIGGTGFYGRWEIRDVLSYLLALADPADDLATARILCSRRWRLSGRDIFHLGQWVRRENGDRGREGEGRPKAARLHLLDAVLCREDVAGLSPNAQARLGLLREEMREHEQARQMLSLGDIVKHVIERTGYRRELQAQTGYDARVALLNLEKLEDMARQFGQGAEGGTLAGYVEWVRYALESGDEEGEVRPIEEETDAVKVMTLHQAKGLEFPIVFIPGLAERIFPTRMRDESDKWYELPWELRGDRDYLPRVELRAVKTSGDLEGALRERKEAEKSLRLDEERRLLYVAITRAQQQLYFSRAHWYGSTARPREASPFWDVVTASGLSQDEGAEECPANNPNVVGRGGQVEPDRSEGPVAAADLEALLLLGADAGGWIDATARSEGYGRWTVLRAEVDAHLKALATARAPAEAPERIDVSCSGLVLYGDCPRRYRFAYVDRLPTRPSPSARFGREVHRQIEEIARPVSPPFVSPSQQELPEEDGPGVGEDRLEDLVDAAGGHAEVPRYETQKPTGEPPDLPGDEARFTPFRSPAHATYAGGTSCERGTVADLVARFRQSVYGRRPATHVEVPFRLSLRVGNLCGRIDRLDSLPDGRWEIIDFKSSASSAEAASIYLRQLALYALAVRELWRTPAERISAHLHFLQDGTDLAFTFADAELDRVRDESETALAAISDGEFPGFTGSRLCEGCSYGHLCVVSDGQSHA